MLDYDGDLSLDCDDGVSDVDALTNVTDGAIAFVGRGRA